MKQKPKYTKSNKSKQIYTTWTEFRQIKSVHSSSWLHGSQQITECYMYSNYLLNKIKEILWIMTSANKFWE